jgi:branched-chain amino acid transport system permease protein
MKRFSDMTSTPTILDTTSTWNAYRKRYGSLVLSLILIAVAFAILVVIKRGDPFFPIWSALAFPALMVSPFIISTLPIRVAIKALLVGIVLLVIVPFVGLEDTFYLELGIQIGIFSSLALGLNIVVGFAGLLDLGYVAFFAIGAYLWGIFTSTGPTVLKLSGSLAAPGTFYLFIFIAVAAAALAGILLGLPVLRLRGDYLAIVTLGFGEMIRLFVSNLSNISSDPKVKINITNGAQGLLDIARPPLPPVLVDLVNLLDRTFNLEISNPTASAEQLFFYLLVLFIGAIIIVVAFRLDNSPIGRAWTAIREDETAAIAMGVPLVRMKLLAFAMGASFAGAMGVIYASKLTYVDPTSIRFEESILILVIVIVGGMGSIRGVLLGGVVVLLLNRQILKNISDFLGYLRNINYVIPIINYPINDWPRELEPVKYERLVFGLLLVLMMIFRPAGILPASRRRMEIETKMGKAKDEPVIDAEAKERIEGAENLINQPNLRQDLESGDPNNAS